MKERKTLYDEQKKKYGVSMEVDNQLEMKT